MSITDLLQHQGRLMLHLVCLRHRDSSEFKMTNQLLYLLYLMMAYATSVDNQGTLLSTVTRVSCRMHHILLLAVRRAVETIVTEVVVPGSLT